MAQTVALQRGSGTLSGNGTSAATLFTQSTGLATRVIFNQLTWYLNSSTNSGGMRAILVLNSSGGQGSVIGLYNAASSSMWGGGFTNKNAGNPMPGAGWNGSTTIISSSSMYQQSSAAAMGSNASAVSLSTGNSYYETMPTNFWMGPSDSLSFRINAQQAGGKGSSPLTVTYSWSFTTITES